MAGAPLRERLAGWLSAWQWVLGLAIALGLSLYGNYWQWRRAITAPLRAQIADQKHALDDSAALLVSARKAAEELALAAQRASANLSAASDGYRRAARERPLPPQCAPGQGRVDAVNRALGAQPEK